MPFLCVKCGAEHGEYRLKCSCGRYQSVVYTPTQTVLRVDIGRRMRRAGDLLNEKTNCKEFPGFEFLGHLSEKYLMVLSGSAGSGKSTFSLIFANAIAKRSCRRMLYVSAEEKHSVTFRKRLEDWRNKGMISERFMFVSEACKFKDAFADIRRLKPHIVVLDSMTAMNMNSEQLVLIHGETQGPTLGILHMTKTGRYKGNSSIAHVADIHCEVENGLVVTKKNRFGPTGKEYEIFTEKKENGRTEESGREGLSQLERNREIGWRDL